MASIFLTGRTRTISKAQTFTFNAGIIMRPEGGGLNCWMLDRGSGAWAQPYFQIVSISSSTSDSVTTYTWVVRFGATAPQWDGSTQTTVNFITEERTFTASTNSGGGVAWSTFHWTVNGTGAESYDLEEYHTTDLQIAEQVKAATISRSFPNYSYNRVYSRGEISPFEAYSDLPSGVSTITAESSNIYAGFNADDTSILPESQQVLIEAGYGAKAQGASASVTCSVSGFSGSGPSLPTRTGDGGSVSFGQVSCGAGEAPNGVTHPPGRVSSGTFGGMRKFFVTVEMQAYDLGGGAFADDVDVRANIIPWNTSSPPETDPNIAFVVSNGVGQSAKMEYGGFTQAANVGGSSFFDTDVVNAAPGLVFVTPPGTYGLGNAFAVAHYLPQRWSALRLSKPMQKRYNGSPWSSSAWTVQTGGTVTTTTAPNALRIQGRTAGTTSFFNFAGGGSGYRYVTCRLRSVGSAQVPVEYQGGSGGAKSVFLTGADGEWVERRVDLVADYLLAATTPIVRADDYKFLLSFTPSFVIPARMAGAPPITIEIEWIDGVSDTGSVMIRSLGQSSANQFLAGYADGADSISVSTATPSGTIENFAVAIGNQNRGWAGLDLTPDMGTEPADPVPAVWFRTGKRSFVYLGGGGFEPTGTGSISTFRDVAFNEQMDLEAVAFAYGLQLYPGCGDILQEQGGGYGSETTLRFRQIFGADVAGVLAKPGARAELLLASDDSPRGEGIRTANGFFVTGEPFGVGGQTAAPRRPGNSLINHKLRVGSRVSPTFGMRQRSRVYALATGEQIVKWLSMDASATGRLVQATTNAAGKIVLRVPVGFGVASWAETETPLSGSRP
ncbi:MAG: hypothetical protein H7Y38_04440, partial [Armatimonadetes bacterium]|nr:hypothetical protein [Armatimonadota bacterium]